MFFFVVWLSSSSCLFGIKQNLDVERFYRLTDWLGTLRKKCSEGHRSLQIYIENCNAIQIQLHTVQVYTPVDLFALCGHYQWWGEIGGTQWKAFFEPLLPPSKQSSSTSRWYSPTLLHFLQKLRCTHNDPFPSLTLLSHTTKLYKLNSFITIPCNILHYQRHGGVCDCGLQLLHIYNWHVIPRPTKQYISRRVIKKAGHNWKQRRLFIVSHPS